MHPEIADTPKTPAAGVMISAPVAQKCPVQRGSCPVQRGLEVAPPVGPAKGGIVAITQKAPRRILRTFKHRFALLVETGKKFQTIRPIPKREQDMPRVGDLFDAREWTGLPRRSKMRKLLPEPARIVSVARCDITASGIIYIDGEPAWEGFARADGFEDRAEMLTWFRDQHGLPFTGIVIDWLPF